MRTISIQKLIFVLSLALLTFTSCGINEFLEQKERLKALMSRKAPKSEIISMLGTNFISYTQGENSWSVLTQVLEKESPDRMVAVREKAPHSQSIMLYSTPEMMTWIFLDKNEKAVDFVVGAQ